MTIPKIIINLTFMISISENGDTSKMKSYIFFNSEITATMKYANIKDKNIAGRGYPVMGMLCVDARFFIPSLRGVVTTEPPRCSRDSVHTSKVSIQTHPSH